MNTRHYVLLLITLSCIVSIAIHLIYIQRLSKRTLREYDYKLNQFASYADYSNQSVSKMNKTTYRELMLRKIDLYNVLESSLNIMSPAKMLYQNSCSLQLNSEQLPEIQILDLYNKLDYGQVIYIHNKTEKKSEILNVFVIPHSHNDPGWLETFEEYYSTRTKHILNNMIDKLPKNRGRKFIWAEISFFQLWWQEISSTQRNIVRRLIKNHQLEIVSGGWVMNDEANTHWISIVYQLTEGHQWLHKNLNYTPISSWSIDPFGLSATQPMLLKEAGLKYLVINRVHYILKYMLSLQRHMEFRWRQIWDSSGNKDMLTHIMAYTSYGTRHTCGPDEHICCQFDFYPQEDCKFQAIDAANVADRAEVLLAQYRQKAKLFETNTLLVTLGNDFSFTNATEWDMQFQNYEKLFHYLNSKKHLNTQIQFGTLSDYFNALLVEQKVSDFPTLSGDFFTYADVENNYWSGYYTTRPFYKRMDRILLHYLRSTEIILTLVQLSGKSDRKWIVNQESKLENARQTFALNQHHDAITGTSRDKVVQKLGEKLMTAILECQNVLQLCVQFLLTDKKFDSSRKTSYYYVNDILHTEPTPYEQMVINIYPHRFTERYVVIFNSLPFARHEVVTFIVSTPFIKVTNSDDLIVTCQVTPIFEFFTNVRKVNYYVSFIVDIPALSLGTYAITALREDDVPPETIFSNIKIQNYLGRTPKLIGFENHIINIRRSMEIEIHNERIVASFNKDGLLQTMEVDGSVQQVEIKFARYVTPRQSSSTTYIFIPNKPAKEMVISNPIKVVEGPIISSVEVNFPYVKHCVRLYNTNGSDSLGLEVHNVVDIRTATNLEFVFSLSTHIKNDDLFFTDLNGYQIIKRMQFNTLPPQANYYPMPTLAYIEDNTARLTILTATPLGVSLLSPGKLEIMLDRRITHTKNLDTITDNRPTHHIFRIVLQRKRNNCRVAAVNHPAGYLSLSAHMASETLLHPLIRLIHADYDDAEAKPIYNPVHKGFNVDFTLPIFRTGIMLNDREYVGFLLHRRYLDLCYEDKNLLEQFPLSDGNINIWEFMPDAFMGAKLNKATLTFLYLGESLNIQNNISICPMEMQSFLLHF